VSVAAKLRHERGVFLRIGKAIDVERSDVFVGSVERETEDAFEMRIGGGCGAANLTDVEAGANVLEQIGDDLAPQFTSVNVSIGSIARRLYRSRCRPRTDGIENPSALRGYLPFFTGSGVGVLV
jgi:hypothetical protein